MVQKIEKRLLAFALVFVLAVEMPLLSSAEDTDAEVKTSAEVQAPAPQAEPSEPAAPSEPAPEPTTPAPTPEPAESEPAQAEPSEPTNPAEPANPEDPVTEAEPSAPAIPSEPLLGSDEPVTNDEHIVSEDPAVEAASTGESVSDEEAPDTDSNTGGDGADPAQAGTQQGGTTDSEPYIVQGDTEYAADSITVGDLTTSIKGLPDDQYEAILTRFAQEIPAALNSDMAYKLIIDSVRDAEKFSTVIDGYDSELCWAATASNMLWTSGYAQSAINPMTGTAFQSEDEVFNYFTQNFTDKPGVPDGAIEYFFNGNYKYRGYSGASQLIDNPYPGDLLPDEDLSEGVIDQRETTDILSGLNELSDVSAGAWLRWWDTGQQKYRNGAHWLTLAGITTDNTKTEFNEKYRGVILADSDNDPYDSSGDADEDQDLWPALAAGQPNSYTFYELSWEDLTGDGSFAWVVLNYSRNTAIKTVLGAVYWLRDKVSSKPAPKPSPQPADDDRQDSEREESTDSTEVIIVPSVEQNIDEIKTVMETNNLVVYSPTDYRYDSVNDDECTLYVRNISTSLLNVYLDGQRLSENQINFRIEILPNGLFKIIFSKEFMKDLKKGKHELLLDFFNVQSVSVVIEVK